MTDALADGDDIARTTLGRIRRARPAVLESELRLPAYQGYLLFPDGLPVARISLTADHVKRRGPARQPGFIARSEERRVGKACVRTCRSRVQPSPTKKNQRNNSKSIDSIKI